MHRITHSLSVIQICMVPLALHTQALHTQSLHWFMIDDLILQTNWNMLKVKLHRKLSETIVIYIQYSHEAFTHHLHLYRIPKPSKIIRNTAIPSVAHKQQNAVSSCICVKLARHWLSLVCQALCANHRAGSGVALLSSHNGSDQRLQFTDRHGYRQSHAWCPVSLSPELWGVQERGGAAPAGQ